MNSLDKLRVELCEKTVGWRDFSIRVNKETIKSTMFVERSFKRKLKSCYFDISKSLSCLIAINKIFEVISIEYDMSLYDYLSVNIIIEKAWSEHRNFFVGFLMVP